MPYRPLARTLLAACFAIAAATAQAQGAWPAKPIRLLVGSPPGGPSDIVTRLLGEQLAQRWKQSVVVENRTGVGNSLAAGVVAKSEPDGYTLVVSPDTVVTTNPLVYTKLNFDARTDLANISVIAQIEKAAMEIMNKPEVRARLQASDLVAVGSTHAQAEAAMKAETARWAPLVKRLDLKQ